MEQNNMDMLYTDLKKQIVINRVLSTITMVASVATLIIVIVICCRVNNFLDMAEPVFEELEKLDMETVNEALENINSVMDFMDPENWKEKFGSIDFEGISELLEGIDVEELKETLENINNGADKLEDVKEWFENSPLNFWKKDE